MRKPGQRTKKTTALMQNTEADRVEQPEKPEKECIDIQTATLAWHHELPRNQFQQVCGCIGFLPSLRAEQGITGKKQMPDFWDGF